MRPAVLAGAMKLPVELIDVVALKRAMTISYQPMGAEHPSHLYCFQESPGYLEVPRQFGLAYCRREGIEYEDRTSMGQNVKFPLIPIPREYQVDALKLIAECFDSYYDFIFRARTGWGKTIGALIVAARMGTTTLIVVDQDNLKDQWIKSLVEHFGFALEDIGIVQGAKCSYAGKAVTIAMVQTLTQRNYSPKFYSYFGMLIVDEVHVIGAPTFSRILLQFSAAFRFGVSATPKRSDGLQKVLDHNLGRVRVHIEDAHDKSSVYIVKHDTVYSWYANTSPKIGRFVTEVAQDGSRNLLLAEMALMLYDSGRDVLVLSDRIEQLHQLKSLCYYLGIPSEEMGLYTGYTPRYSYEKDPAPLRKPEGHERGTEYTPVILKSVSKRLNAATLEHTKTTARVIFATYGKFSKGVDEPRLNGGIDATPRSKSEQVQGRILRKVKGKLRAIWVTACDTSSYRSMHTLTGRIADYVKNNSDIYTWSSDKGRTLCETTELLSEVRAEVKRLKSTQIRINNAGLNMLVTPQQEIESVRLRVSAHKTVVRRRAS